MRYQIQRSKDGGVYVYELKDTQRDVTIAATVSRSPIPPQDIRDVQARYNTDDFFRSL